MPAYNTIEYITISTEGNTTDFGDLASAVKVPPAGGSSTRALIGRATGGFSNAVNYVTIASTGNATDFGDLSDAPNEGTLAASNSTICLFFGGNISGTHKVQIDEFTISSLGNATDFGDLRLNERMSNAGGAAAASNCHGGLS